MNSTEGLQRRRVTWLRGVVAAATLVVTAACADSPLELAIKAGDVKTVRTELAALSTSGQRLPSAAFEYALWQLSPSESGTTEILEMLLASVPDAERTALVHRSVLVNRGSKGRTASAAPVEVAARRWSPDGVRALLDNGLVVPSEAVQGALVAAAANGCDPIITMLLDAGADVNAMDSHGDTPLAMARRVNNQKVVTLLLARGAGDK